MDSCKPTRRTLLRATGVTLAGMALASVWPPALESAQAPESLSGRCATERWLLETGKSALDPELHALVMHAIEN